MAIDIHSFEQKNLLEQFLTDNNLKLISDITLSENELGVPLDMREGMSKSYEDIYHLFKQAKIEIKRMFNYRHGTLVTNKPHMIVFVSTSSDFFNTEKLVESDTGVCHKDESGNLTVCKEMKDRIFDDLRSSDYWKTFNAEFENRTLKNIKIGFKKLDYCPFCGGKTNDFSEIEREIPNFVELRR